MKTLALTLILMLLILSPVSATGQGAINSTDGAEQEAPSVTAVYGVTTDDYLLPPSRVRQQLRPSVRKVASHVAFDLPDAFYFIGGPVFILILLRVLVLFLDSFEEARREEERQAASERLNYE